MSRYPREYFPGLFSQSEADEFFFDLSENLAWKQYDITLFGKKFLQPRLVAFYGDDGVTYSYSKTYLEGAGREKSLLLIKERIEKLSGQSFNSVLCNLYRDGNDSMGWHSDDEKELGPDPVIASCSFGQERMFHLKHKQTNEKQKILLEHGSCILMKAGCQTNRQHAINKSKKALGPRINLTFRTII